MVSGIGGTSPFEVFGIGGTSPLRCLGWGGVGVVGRSREPRGVEGMVLGQCLRMHMSAFEALLTC